MALSLEELFSVELLQPQAEAQVIDLLKRTPIPVSEKWHVYGRWCRFVGIVPLPERFHLLGERRRTPFPA